MEKSAGNTVDNGVRMEQNENVPGREVSGRNIPQDEAMRKIRVQRREQVRRHRVCIRGLRGKEFFEGGAETVYYAAGVKHGDQEGGEKDRNSDF